MKAKSTPTGWEIALEPKDAGQVIQFENTGRTQLWFRFKDVLPKHAWVTTNAGLLRAIPSVSVVDPSPIDPPKERFIPGRFGKGIVIRSGTTLSLPDHQKVDGAVKRFFDVRQGTLEFWIKILWDPRLRPVRRMRYLSNGLIDVIVPYPLPYREWAHVALVWRPLKSDPKRVVMHVYVNGIDRAYYRSTHWDGYSRVPLGLAKNGKWLGEFVAKTPPGTIFAIDELRLSSSPRYADLDVVFGGQQTVNPYLFDPHKEPHHPDGDTMLLFHFDNDLANHPALGRPVVQGKLQTK